jgi:hypothetical protein
MYRGKTILKDPFLPNISGRKKIMEPIKYPMKYDDPIILYLFLSMHKKFIFTYQLSKYSAFSLFGKYSMNRLCFYHSQIKSRAHFVKFELGESLQINSGISKLEIPNP